MSRIMGKPYAIAAFIPHINSFTEDGRGAVLQRIGEPRRFRYRFRNPLIQPFAVMQGLNKGLVTNAGMRSLNRASGDGDNR